MITMSHTWWECPTCQNVGTVDAAELSAIGIPFCDCKEDQEMEPMEAPIPTVVNIDDGEGTNYMGIALRPVNIQRAVFKKKIGKLWKKWLAGLSVKQNFQDFTEENGLIWLKSDEVVVKV